MHSHLQRIFPTELKVFSDSKLEEIIEDRADQAMAFGLSTKGDVRRYLEVSFAQSWPEGKPPLAIEKILQRIDLSPCERMDYIEQGITLKPE